MATTIQECASLSALERRERRKQKILNNAESRLNKLLSGPDGTTRAAPGIDGAPSPVQPSTAAERDSQLNASHSSQTSTRTAKEIDEGEIDFSKLQSSVLGDESLNSTHLDFVMPTYWDSVDKNRFYLVGIMGLILTILAQYHLLNNVIWPIILVQLSYEIFMFRSRKFRYPKHGYVVNILLAAGLDDNIVINAGVILDIGWELMVDLVLISFVYVSSNVVVQTTHKLLQYLASF
ncbi:unnamed protein product [Bursaphelenchus xylophilus]|uniref:(pine wood nematode) hypothetical protein n=1 Tax=Bursaphelenchus xylophilus TaxID=6326 RepID=A0A1I7RM43_BURXY|nr:unnamed protein product [Bursaphelenchus xylophilus]CAG9118187.1 unnamed protein product [Bursaphelenchus xylophilus]